MDSHVGTLLICLGSRNGGRKNESAKAAKKTGKKSWGKKGEKGLVLMAISLF